MKVMETMIHEIKEKHDRKIEKIIFMKLDNLEVLCKFTDLKLYNIIYTFNSNRDNISIYELKNQLEEDGYQLELEYPEIQLQSIQEENSYSIKSIIDESKIKLKVKKIIYQL